MRFDNFMFLCSLTISRIGPILSASMVKVLNLYACVGREKSHKRIGNELSTTKRFLTQKHGDI